MSAVETELHVSEIQGNILAGFNKDHQWFLFLRILPAAEDVTKARQWLKTTLLPLLSNTRQVLDFNRAFRVAVVSGATRPKARWVNVGLSAAALRRIRTPAEVEEFSDEAFKFGMAKRSEFLGDPTDRASPGNWRNWQFGGPTEKAVDIVVIVASDDPAEGLTVVNDLLASLPAGGLELVFRQDGQTLPGAFAGHEHFGFKDGVSQPGVRGLASSAAGDFITPRTVKSPSSGPDPRASTFGKPGQILIWPGEFILGENRQPQDPLTVANDFQDPATNFPSWAAGGSFLVIRRLRQNYAGFWGFVPRQAHELGIDPVKFASQLVGRWPSGAPIMRSPAAERQDLGDDDLANNHFAFNRPTEPILVEADPRPGGDNTYPQAPSDFLGEVCPRFAHIRKVNPRDGATDLGVAQDTLSRAILRRGIPYGPSVLGIASPTPEQLAADRGLIFACYQASIVNQFETIIRRWANTPNQPTPGGHDPIIGQTELPDGNRRRFIDLASGQRCFLAGEWITPTGGEYFFAPSLEAIRVDLGE